MLVSTGRPAVGHRQANVRGRVVVAAQSWTGHDISVAPSKPAPHDSRLLEFARRGAQPARAFRFVAAQLVETALDQAEGDRLSGRLGALEHVDGDQLGGLLHAHLVSVPREVKYQLRQLCNLKGT